MASPPDPHPRVLRPSPQAIMTEDFTAAEELKVALDDIARVGWVLFLAIDAEAPHAHVN